MRDCAPRSAVLLLCALFGFLLLLTRPTYIGDTVWYARDIDRALSGGWLHSPHIWEFAHLLLRPLGLALAWAFAGPASLAAGGDREAGIALLLVIVSAASALACALVIYRMTWRVTHNNPASLAAAAAFLCSSVVLNYSRSGSSYLPGLAFSLSALYWSGFSSTHPRRRAVLSGISAAFSVLLWLPYLVSFPAILLAGPILNLEKRDTRSHVVFGLVFCAVAGFTLLAAFGTAALVVHATSWSSLFEWVRASEKQYRDRKALRMITGLARSFYEMGNDAVWLKWFVFKDPYARVGWLDLARASFMRLAFCYASLAGLIALLWRSVMGRRILLLAAVVAVPHIGMALVFESGSPERYLAALPLIFAGFAYAMSDPLFGPRARVAAAALCFLHVPFNLVALSAPMVAAPMEAESARLSSIAAAGPSGVAYVLNNLDGAWVARHERLFNPVNRESFPEMLVIVSPGPRAGLWRSDFACLALETWDRGGQVLVTKRVLAEKPDRRWFWVEGDDPRWNWAQIHAFFTRLDRNDQGRFDDGFFRVPDTGAVRDEIAASAAGGCRSR